MSDITVDFPVSTDDTGPGDNGTVYNKAFFDSVIDAINTQVYSVTNPTLTPADIIDEVVTARGNLASLNARISPVISVAGAFIPPSTIGTAADIKTVLGSKNLMANDTFLIWPAGDAAAPAHFVLAGSGAAVARAGSGLGDTTRKVGSFCAKVTYGSATATLTQVLLDAGVFGTADILKGVYSIGVGCWVWCDAASIAKIGVTDGATTTRSAAHTGNSTWQWLPLSAIHPISGSGTKLEVFCEVSGSGSAYFSGLTAVFGNYLPSMWIPSEKVRGTIVLPVSGTLTTGVKQYFAPARPMIVSDVQLLCATAPTGQALKAALKHWDGSTWQSVFSTVPEIAAAGNYGNAVPDGTYRYRCFSGTWGASAGADGVMHLDLTQVGSGVAGSDLWAFVRGMQYKQPLEDFLAYNDIGT